MSSCQGDLDSMKSQLADDRVVHGRSFNGPSLPTRYVT